MENYWLQIITTSAFGAFLGAVIAGVLNLFIAGYVKPWSDAFATRYNSNHKIREEIAIAVLTSILDAKAICFNIKFDTSADGLIECESKASKAEEEFKMLLAKSQLYLSEDMNRHFDYLPRSAATLRTCAHSLRQYPHSDLEKQSIQQIVEETSKDLQKAHNDLLLGFQKLLLVR